MIKQTSEVQAFIEYVLRIVDHSDQNLGLLGCDYGDA